MKKIIIIFALLATFFQKQASAQLFPQQVEDIATKLSDANFSTKATNGIFVAGGILIIYDLITPNKGGCQTKKKPSKYRKQLRKNRKKTSRRNRRRRK